MEKRTVLALVLIAIIYWFSAQYLWKPPQTAQTMQSSGDVIEQTTPNTFVPEEVFTQGQSISFTNQATQIDDNIILENEKILISFTNLGAVINQIILKGFYKSDKVTPVSLIPDNQSILQINNILPQINETLFEYDKTRSEVKFYVNNPDTGSSFIKRYVLGDDYQLDFYLEGENLPAFDSYIVSLNSGINITEDHKAAVKDIRNSFKFVTQVDRESKSVALQKFSKGDQSFFGNVSWAAVRSKYFVMSLIPSDAVMAQSVRAQKVSETLGFYLTVKYNYRVTRLSDNYSLYLGPVDYDILQTYNNGMEHIAEMGAKWLRPLAKLFKLYIQFLYRFIPNYGVVIIIFAFTLKLLLTPLTNKALHSGRKMQQIQPLVREIQTKYKNDIKKQQEELRNIYKEHKVSPMGGCLPLLLQMPIFFALYPVLRFSIELRQASFTGWLIDLSEPDPYWVLPILMGVFMFIQQKMTQSMQDTSQMDEKQQAMMQSQKMMMYMMPPFMVFIFSNLPAGLVLYWTTFNVFSIIQQYFLNKKLKQSKD